MVKKLTAEEKALFIRCILKLKEIEDLVEGFQLFCDRVLEEVSVKEIFEYSPDAAYDFCCLLKQQNLEEREEVRNDLRWIQQNFGEEISVKFARKIKELALTES